MLASLKSPECWLSNGSKVLILILDFDAQNGREHNSPILMGELSFKLRHLSLATDANKINIS